MPEENYILFKINPEQARFLCKYWDSDYNTIDEQGICNLLDKTIDQLNGEIVEED